MYVLSIFDENRDFSVKFDKNSYLMGSAAWPEALNKYVTFDQLLNFITCSFRLPGNTCMSDLKTAEEVPPRAATFFSCADVFLEVPKY